MSRDREQTATLQTALLHRARGAPSDADPDANRSAGLHSYRVDLEVIETTCAAPGLGRTDQVRTYVLQLSSLRLLLSKNIAVPVGGGTPTNSVSAHRHSIDVHQ